MHVHIQKINTRTNNTIPDTILIPTKRTTLVLLDTYQGPAYTLMVLAARLVKNLRTRKENA
jgi:hypothetical protein